MTGAALVCALCGVPGPCLVEQSRGALPVLWAQNTGCSPPRSTREVAHRGEARQTVDTAQHPSLGRGRGSRVVQAADDGSNWDDHARCMCVHRDGSQSNKIQGDKKSQMIKYNNLQIM